MFERRFSGSPWEKKFGFCRAIRVGQMVHLAGTAPILEGEVFAPGDPFAQAERCLEIALEALVSFGLDLDHVYRVRWYLTDIQDQDAVGRAHHAAFAEHPPVATMVEVKGLVDPAMRVELELEAMCP